MIENIILDACGVVMVLLLLIPHLSGGPGSRFNRRKLEWLLYAALLHIFTLCIRLTGTISAIALPETAADRIFRIVAMVPSVASAVLLALGILSDSDGKLHLKMSTPIPVGQIACAVLPAVLALCLRIIFPELSFWGNDGATLQK